MQLKYYLYISDAKVDMLFPQIPRGFLDGLAGELKLNVGILNASLKQDSLPENRYSKLEVVKRYIERNMEIGDIDSPREYFYGSGYVRWGKIDPDLVYFMGKTEKTIFGLGGSLHHITGSNVQTQSLSFAYSFNPGLPDLLVNLLTGKETSPENGEIMSCLADVGLNTESVAPNVQENLEFSKRQESGVVQKVEFMAKNLLFGDASDVAPKLRRKVLLGTPIYVALSQ